VNLPLNAFQKELKVSSQKSFHESVSRVTHISLTASKEKRYAEYWTYEKSPLSEKR
jgi:hypothetical protein